MSKVPYPIPPRTERRRLKYQLAAVEFIHHGKTLQQAAKEQGMTYQNLHQAASQDDWKGFQTKLLTGELETQGASFGLVDKLRTMIDEGKIQMERALSMGTVDILQTRRAEVLEELRKCPLEQVPLLLNALTKLRREIEDVLFLTEMRGAVPKLLVEKQRPMEDVGVIVDLS